jgi:NADH-quinone oxidoreductase subunit C
MPDAPGLELIAQDLNEAADGAVLGTYYERDQACLIVDPAGILEVLRWLRDTPGQEYRFLASLHAADYLPAEPRFGVHYELLNMPRVERLHVKALLADPAAGNGAEVLPEIDSCVELFPTAAFQEREAYEMFGIRFRGHPDLRRLLTDYGFIGHPFRKDFPLIGNVEVRYDPAKGRVVYEPVGIEPRTLVPKVIRDDARYAPDLKDQGNA